jgi:hypothetical protein
MHIVFAGDFFQLEPVLSKNGPLFKTPCEEFNGSINCYIELKGMHRFQEDPEYGRFLLKLREGNGTENDISWINERVVKNGKTKDGDSIPVDVKYCTYDNKDRDAINAGIFYKHCKQQFDTFGRVDKCMLIFCSEVQSKNFHKYFQPFRNTKNLHEKCSESDIEVSKYSVGRMDPVLKLYVNCPVMLPYNENVSKGLANGTQGNVTKIHLVPGTVPKTILLDGNIPVQSVLASQVASIEVNHLNSHIEPSNFIVKPKTIPFKAPIPIRDNALHGSISISMKATQAPLISNNATTGHKLQGCGVKALFVTGWDYRQKNWVYVVLSRVTTKRGLFLRQPLVWKEGRFDLPDGLKSMLDGFSSKAPNEISPAEYESFFD